MRQFVQNFLSYVSAKYNLNWFTVGESYQKNKKGELFYWDTVYNEQYKSRLQTHDLSLSINDLLIRFYGVGH